MGIFCMVAGIVTFVAFIFTGYVWASMMLMSSFFNVLSGAVPLELSEIFKLPTAANASTYIIWIGIFGFLGLVIGLGMFMNGLIYKKLDNVERKVRRISRKISKKSDFDKLPLN